MFFFAFRFVAKDAATIEQFIHLPKSKCVYVIIAQALDERVPPYILQMYGTTQGSFTAKDVVRRWEFTVESLRKYVYKKNVFQFHSKSNSHSTMKYIHTRLHLYETHLFNAFVLISLQNFESFRHGIEVEGISSDGDPRLLAAMCANMCTTTKTIRIQDSIHLANKFRNRMLKLLIHLAMGSFDVSITHLQWLVKNVQKSVHGLSQIDVCPIDRMNFNSFEKVADDRVLEALKVHVKNSDATIQYLKIAREVTSSFLSYDLHPNERLFQIWHGVFFHRIWRQFILSSKKYTLKDNFITSNTYVCLELNARNLTELVKQFRDEKKEECFLPPLFDSQSCEKMFRVFRSMGTAQYTKINFSLYELLHMVGRIEVQHEIAYVKLANESVVFPNKRTGKTKIFSLPSDDEINTIIAKAKQTAIDNAAKLGMTTVNNIDTFEFQSKEGIFDPDEDDEDCCTENIAEDEMIQNLPEDDQLDSESCDENSPYIIVRDESGVKRKIRKSIYIWMLTEPSERISNDRLRRFQAKSD